MCFDGNPNVEIQQREYTPLSAESWISKTSPSESDASESSRKLEAMVNAQLELETGLSLNVKTSF